MRLVTNCEQRFDRLPDGSVWTRDAFAYEYWAPYLRIFADVCIVARVREAAADDRAGKRRVDGNGVRVVGLPHYIGPWQFLLQLLPIRKAMRKSVAEDDAVILRGVQLAAILRITSLGGGRPYGCEVVGDPYDVFARGVVDHPLRPFLRPWFAAELRRQCAGAAAALYVTQSYLQRRYPCPGRIFSASDVQVDGEAFASAPREFSGRTGPFRLIAVGTLDQMYKGQDLLIEAVGELVKRGRDLQLTFVGGGRLRPRLESLAAMAGIGDRVVFAGPLPSGAPVRREIDRADLFVMPSRTEGLPRALIEGMARGLPAIASAVGGIPELLDPEDLVSPGDARKLAGALDAAITNRERLARMSARNLERARSFTHERLLHSRLEFQQTIFDVTAEWIAGGARHLG